jgi:hypothetical protein
VEWGQQTALLFFFLHKINPSNLFLSLLLVVAAHVWCMFGARLTQLDSSSMIELRIPMVLISKDQKSIKNRSKIDQKSIKKNDQKERSKRTIRKRSNAEHFCSAAVAHAEF